MPRKNRLAQLEAAGQKSFPFMDIDKVDLPSDDFILVNTEKIKKKLIKQIEFWRENNIDSKEKLKEFFEEKLLEALRISKSQIVVFDFYYRKNYIKFILDKELLVQIEIGGHKFVYDEELKKFQPIVVHRWERYWNILKNLLQVYFEIRKLYKTQNIPQSPYEKYLQDH